MMGFILAYKYVHTAYPYCDEYSTNYLMNRN